MRYSIRGILFVFSAAILMLPLFAAPRKPHTAALGAPKKVPYSQSGDPAGAIPGEDSLKTRPLVIDGTVKDWTTGDPHDITDRSFVIRRALRINDELPGEKPAAHASHWVWQRGPWLLVDRTTGHITAIKLPDYDPAVSRVTWFRDYAAYCGLTPSGKSLYAMVAQLSARKPVVSRKLDSLKDDAAAHASCEPPEWQRDPLRVTFHPAGKDAVNIEIAPGSAVLVEDSIDDADAAKTKQD